MPKPDPDADEAIQVMRRYHHFPKEITDLAHKDAALFRFLELYQQGGVNYVDILEQMVIFQTNGVKTLQDENQQLQQDTAVLLRKGPSDVPRG
jgi:hypothetical protein